MQVAWGGAAGAYEDGGRATVATTSSGDARIDAADTFVTVMQNATGVADPRQGPSGHGPSAHVLGSRPALRTATGDMYADPFADAYPGFDPAHVGYVFTLDVPPRTTVALVTFVVKGLSEVYDPRGGYPIARPDALLFDVERSGLRRPRRARARGRERDRPRDRAGARRWSRRPTCAASRRLQQSQIVNWDSARGSAPPAFTVFEQSVEQLQAAMTAGHGDQRGHRPRLPDPRGRLRSPRSHLQGAAGAQPARHRRCPRSRCGARRRTRARSLPRRADRAEGQHRHDRAAHHRRRAGAGRSPSARRLAGRRRDEGRGRGDPRQGQPRRVPVRRLRHQHRRRHGRQRLRSVALAPPGRAAAAPPPWPPAWRRSASAPTPATRCRTPRLRLAGHHPHDPRPHQPGRRDAAQHLQRRGRADGPQRARHRARARPGHRRRSGGSGHARSDRARRAVVRRQPGRGLAEGRAHRRVPPALRRHHRRARSRRDDGARGQGAAVGGCDGGGRRGRRLRRQVPRRPRQRARDRCWPAGRRTCRAAPHRAIA